MKKRIRMAVVGIAAAVMMAGCSAAEDGAWRNPTVSLDPVPTVAPTVAAAEPAKEEYEFGDIVYSLEAWHDGSYHVSRHAVVAHVDDVLIVTTAIGATAEDIRAGLPMAIESWADTRLGDCISQLRASKCYATKAEAQAVADELSSGR